MFTRMMFGKYRGCYLSVLPEEYLRAVLGRDELDPDMEAGIESELKRRVTVPLPLPPQPSRRPVRMDGETLNDLVFGTEIAIMKEVEAALKSVYRELLEDYRPASGRTSKAMLAIEDFYAVMVRALERI